MKEKINPHFFHFLNDRSGSPRVLAQVIEGFLEKGITCHLHTSKHDGFLSDLTSVQKNPLPYDYNSSKLILLMIFLWNQLICFKRVLFIREKNSLVYVNTILPAGAIIAGWFRGFPVINHVHETSIKPKALKWLLMTCSKNFSSKLISVSHFLADEESLPMEKTSVIYNALPKGYLEQKTSLSKQKAPDAKFRILMLCSLKDYKGIPEFLAIAKASPQFDYELVINAQQEQVNEYLKDKEQTTNVQIWSSQKNVSRFYERADLVLNLSRPDQWVETFGLTAIEAMAYGLPVIVPPVGGIAEVVRNEVEGFQIDCRNIVDLLAAIELLANDKQKYRGFSFRSSARAQDFNLPKLKANVLSEVFNLFQTLEITPEFTQMEKQTSS